MSGGHRKPLVGITCDYARVRDQPAQTVIERYYHAVQRISDASTVLIPETSEVRDLDTLLDRVDGILLTGSPSNIEPSRYGDHSECGPFDLARDATTFPLLERARERHLPILGICRGMQEINVSYGGTLKRDLNNGIGSVLHHAEAHSTLDELFEVEHSVSLVSNGVLSRLFRQPLIDVNSVHYQGIADLGLHLTIEATAGDGLIEAIVADDAPILGVQWHPEWHPSRSPGSVQLFRMFGACVRGASPGESAALVSGDDALLRSKF